MMYGERVCESCGGLFSGPMPGIQTAYNDHTRTCGAKKPAPSKSKAPPPQPPRPPRLAKDHLPELKSLTPNTVPPGFVDALIRQHPSLLYGDCCKLILEESNRHDKAIRIGRLVNTLREATAPQALSH